MAEATQIAEEEKPVNEDQASKVGEGRVVRIQTHQGIKRIRIAGDAPTKEEYRRINERYPEISTFRKLEYGVQSTFSDVQNLDLLSKAAFPHLVDPNDKPEGFDELSVDERRDFLFKQRDAEIKEKYADVIRAGEDDSGFATVGSFLGAVLTPTSLLPIGATWKGMAGIGAVLGAEWNFLDQFAEKGEVSPKEVAVSASLGGVLAPAVGVPMQKLVRLRQKKRNITLKENQEAINLAEARKQAGEEWDAKGIVQGPGRPIRETREQYINRTTDSTTDQGVEAAVVSGRRIEKEDPRVVEAVTSIDKGSLATARRINSGLSGFIGSVSDMIERVGGKQWKRKLHEHDQGVYIGQNNSMEIAREFFKGVKKLSPGGRKEVDLKLLNGSLNRTVLERLNFSPKAIKSFEESQKHLDELHSQLVSSGAFRDGAGYLKNYWPRNVKDIDGLRETYPEVQKALADAKKKKTLSDDEVQAIVRRMMHKQQVREKRVRLDDKRQIPRVDEDTLPFYDNIESSYTRYVMSAHEQIQLRKFFRGHKKVNEDKSLNIDESVESLLRKEGGDLAGEQIQALTKLFGARFGKGNQSPAKWVQGFRSSIYLSYLTNPIAASTQLGDAGIATFTQDVGTALRAAFGKKRITVAMQGLDSSVAGELLGELGIAKMLHKAFTISGFRAIDRFGKELLMNAAALRAQKLSKSEAGRAALKKRYGEYFGDDFDTFLDDVNRGNFESENVLLYAWSELAEAQPISPGEYPLKYLQIPNGRLMYTLKSFSIKQLNLLRRRIIDEWQHGSKKQALKNAVAYSLLVPGGQTAVSYIKDGLLARDMTIDDLPDRWLEHHLRLFFGSKYLVEKQRKKLDAQEIAAEVFVPPIDHITSVGNALLGDTEDKTEATKHIPFIGKLFHNYFLGGRERADEKTMDRRIERLRG